MRKLIVDLGDKSYPIYFQENSISKFKDFLSYHDLGKNFIIITDQTVKNLYADRILSSLKADHYTVNVFTIQPGERSKSLSVANDLYTQLIQLGTTREDVIIALGGGVVGDLAGFVASTFLRGVPFIQVPTTVLAQVDSSVGGKVGINHALGKNLIGSFYHPSFVLIDPLVLETLDERERSAGFAEVIKYGLIADKTFFHTLQNNIDSLIQLSDFKLLQTVLERCCQIKVDIVQADEKEKGLRAILNFGHTLGHALEAVTNYEYFLHGEAVAWGMIGALYLSEKYDFNQDIKSVIHLIEKLSIPELPVNIAAGQIIHAIKRDKKRKRSGQVWVLLEQIGHAYLEQNIPTDLVREATEYMIRQKVGI